MSTKNDHRMISASDDIAKMMEQVLANYAPDGHKVDVGPILSIIENIFRRATATPGKIGVQEGTREHMDELHEALSDIIHKISCEISCKCSGGGDALATTMALFNTLSSYSWDAKMVLSLAAFAVNYGEFWLVAHLRTENSIAQSVAVLKQLRHIPAHYDELNKLIKAMLELTKCIVNLKQLRFEYLSPEGQAKFNEAHFQAAYWTFRSIVACNSQTLSPSGFRHEETAPTTEEMELSTLTHKVSDRLEGLNKQSESWKEEIENMQNEEYKRFKNVLGKKTQDNMEVLREFFNAKDFIQTLVDGEIEIKTTVQIEVLNKKHVLLLISSLDDLSTDEISVIKKAYKDIKASKECQVVWLPIVERSVDWQHEHRQKFETLQKEMPWYTVQNPRMIRPAVIKYINKERKFSEKAILVAVDPQGNILNPNAFHMLRIWGTSAFPFTAEREAELSKIVTQEHEIIFGDINATILKWMNEDRLVCLYGGEDEAWIRGFTISAKAVASNPKIKLGIAYVGKKNTKKRQGEISSSISKDDSSHILLDSNAMQSFWERLESMLYLKLQGMRKVMTLLNFDGSEQGWAIFCGGKTQEIAGAMGKAAIDSLKHLQNWEGDASPENLIKKLKSNLAEYHSEKHCYRVIVAIAHGAIPVRVTCADCGKAMNISFTYSCCCSE